MSGNERGPGGIERFLARHRIACTTARMNTIVATELYGESIEADYKFSRSAVAGFFLQWL